MFNSVNTPMFDRLYSQTQADYVLKMLRNTGYISGESHNRELNGMFGTIAEAKEAEKYPSYRNCHRAIA